MKDWNVVVSVYNDGFDRAKQLLTAFGQVANTSYYNVLVLKVDDPDAFLARIDRMVENVPDLAKVLSRVEPAQRTFDFDNPEDFERRARAIALDWAPRLAGKSFHVRMHRRGLKGEMSGQAEEQFLDGALLGALDAAGAPGRITFDDPAMVVAVETVGHRAGMSIWSREDLKRHPLLRID